MNKGPNVLWITLESVRADHTSLYGYERNTTPNIQAESERSDATVLSTAISQSIWTPASTASILTGTYLSTHQLGQDGKAQRKLQQGIETLPQLLSQQGYETVLFSPNAYISSATGLDRGFETVVDLVTTKSDFFPWKTAFLDNWICAIQRLREMNNFSLTHYKNDVAHNPTSTVPRRFRRWETRVRKSNRPYFAYIHLNAPHHPYLPVAKYRDLYTSCIDLNVDNAYSLVEDRYSGSDALKRQMAQGIDFDQKEWEGHSIDV